jgi:hypothetical protein
MLGCDVVVAVVSAMTLLGIFACLFWQFSKPGPKLDGGIAIGAVCAMHVWAFLGTLAIGPYQLIGYSAIILGEALLVTWLAFSVIAIRRWQTPDRTIGFFSLVLLLSPGVLWFLADFQTGLYEVCGFHKSWDDPCLFLMRCLWLW